MGGSIGGSKSKSESSSDQRVWDPQGDALKDLYDRAGNLFDSGQTYFDRMNQWAGDLDPYNKQLMDRGLGGQEQMLGGGSYGDTSDIRNMLMDNMRRQSGGSQMGKMYESILGGSGNTYIDPMVDAMKESSMENLQGLQNQTAMDAARFGQGGSSRHAMQNAMQAKAINQDMMNREQQMRGGAYDKDLAMKMGIAQQADTNALAQNQLLQGMLSGADQNVQAGMGAGSGLQNLGMGGMAPWMQANQMPWSNMTQYANVIGRPTVLGSSSGSGSSKGMGVGASAKG